MPVTLRNSTSDVAAPRLWCGFCSTGITMFDHDRVPDLSPHQARSCRCWVSPEAAHDCSEHAPAHLQNGYPAGYGLASVRRSGLGVVGLGALERAIHEALEGAAQVVRALVQT